MTDLEMRLVAYDQDTPAAVLPSPTSIQWGAPINDTPTLQFTYSDYPSVSGAPFLDLLIPSQVDVALEVTKDGDWVEMPSSRFIMMDQSNDTADPTNMMTFVGIGVDDDLNGVQITDKSKFNADGKLVFTNATPGQILRTFHDFGVANGMLNLLTTDFSTSQTSAQDEDEPWNDTITWEMPFGTSYRAALDMLVSYGMINWRCEGNKLRVFNDSAEGHPSDWGGMQRDYTDGANPVELIMGRECVTGPQSISRRNLANKVLVTSDNNSSWLRSNSSLAISRGDRVITFDQGGIATEGAADVIGDRLLDGAKSTREQLTRELKFDSSLKFLPWYDYRPGDWIYGPSKAGGAIDRLRVSQITLTQDDKGTLGGSIILNDRLLERSVAVQKQLAALQGGATIGTGGGSTKPAPPGRTPAKPSGTPTVTGAAYVDKTGHVRATINIVWSGVTSGVDGQAIDIDHYEVRMRKKKKVA